MPSALPDGDPAPADGALPGSALEQLGSRPLGVYVHVPFCTVRCGYCDFNTYTADELGDGPGASRSTYADAAVAEVRLARRVLGETPPVDTVFLGGGTPTLLPPGDLARILGAEDYGSLAALVSTFVILAVPDAVAALKPDFGYLETLGNLGVNCAAGSGARYSSIRSRLLFPSPMSAM